MISILGDRAANVDITWYHWPCNIDITKNRFYMAARIDKIVISELAATDLLIPHRSSKKKKVSWSDQPPCPSSTTLAHGHHKVQRRLIPVAE